jgi:hypothetical protein
MSTNKENIPVAHSEKADVSTSAPLSETAEVPAEPPKDPRLRRTALPNPLVDNLITEKATTGVLIPLKTTQEVRQDYSIIQALITRAPTKTANDILA